MYTSRSHGYIQRYYNIYNLRHNRNSKEVQNDHRELCSITYGPLPHRGSIPKFRYFLETSESN